MEQYREDPEYLEKIHKNICPYCERTLKRPHKGKRECTCGFILLGDPQAVAYNTIDTIDYTYDTRHCPEEDCNSSNLIYEREEKELVCFDCGLVLTSQHQYVGLIKIDYPFGLHIDSISFI